ncbi:hypothetical protein RV06_GL002208 [Enterococcus haemoperoxidus]|nr:hypothetical protein RV06_GL002208 [Enterococcus haemoperoxidus]
MIIGMSTGGNDIVAFGFISLLAFPIEIVATIFLLLPMI